jgi:hypothetical protein
VITTHRMSLPEGRGLKTRWNEMDCVRIWLMTRLTQGVRVGNAVGKTTWIGLVRGPTTSVMLLSTSALCAAAASPYTAVYCRPCSGASPVGVFVRDTRGPQHSKNSLSVASFTAGETPAT